MEKGSTIFLRGAVLVIGLVVLALCVFLLPAGIRDDKVGGYRLILLGMYVPTIPFYVGLYQTLKLLGLIDKNKAFSDLSVKALGYLKYCALVISGLYAAGMPYIYMVADKDDAPGVIVLGLTIVFAAMIVATLAAVLQKLLRNAIDIKAENDLTV